jgi:GNAT superfamily N-acetyltransferase
MASTESTTASAGAASARPVRPLVDADLAGCLALSLSAEWNQNEADWRMMLDLGRGWGIDAPSDDGSTALAASVVVIPYSPSPYAAHSPGAAGGGVGHAGCAWVSMVLVLPQFRRLGLAKQLLRHALGILQTEGMLPVLDATPAGYPVYLQQGFGPTWGFRRYRRAAISLDPAAADAPRTRRITDDDWPAIMAFDGAAFGADRKRLLQALARRMPQAARVAQQDGRITGFVLGRDGREACQIGPLVADDARIAQILVDDVLDTVATPVQVDLADRHLSLLQGLVARGFMLQRPFTRMVLGAPDAPGDPARVVLMAGPELG